MRPPPALLPFQLPLLLFLFFDPVFLLLDLLLIQNHLHHLLFLLEQQFGHGFLLLPFTLVDDILLHGENLPHLFCEFTESDGRVVVDGESEISGIVNREQTLVVLLHLLFLKLGCKVVDAHVLRDILEEYLEEHPGCGSRVIRGEFDHRQDLPVEGLPVE